MQRTEKYFEQDAFRTQCESTILAAEPDEKAGGGRIARRERIGARKRLFRRGAALKIAGFSRCVSKKEALCEKAGESKARQRCVDSMEAKFVLLNTLLPSLPILSRRRHIICCRYGLALPPEIPRRSAKGDSETLVRMRIVTHKKRPAARQDVSLREISTGDESALLPEPAADFQTGFFPDWPRSARPSARSPSDCSGRSGSRKSCRGRRPAQGRAP